jgi:hypothetical protein
MKCGWGCDADRTGRQMRAILICRKRSVASERRDRRRGARTPSADAGPANALRLALRRETDGERNAKALHQGLPVP